MRLRIIEDVRTVLPDIEPTDGELVSRLINNSAYFHNQSLIKSVKHYLLSSIGIRGLDPKYNPFLRFVLDDKINRAGASLVTINTNYVSLLYKNLMEGNIKFDKGGAKGYGIEKWIFDPKAYDLSKYKVNALLLLSMPDQLKRFVKGDKLLIENRPFQAILDAHDDEEIRDILDAYAPEGEEEEDEVELDGDSDESKEKAFNYFRPIVSTRISDDDLKVIIEQGLKKVDDLRSLQPFVVREVAKKLGVSMGS